VAGDGLRATTGLVRAACFNILAEQVIGAQVVDLFAGIGSLGLEALSRGAARVTFVEADRHRAQVIATNLEALGFAERGEVMTGDGLAWLRRQSSGLGDFRLVLLDPPYRDAGPQLCLDALGLLGRAAEGLTEWDPRVVAEHHRDLSVPTQVGALNCVRTARYGTTVLSFYRRLP
jgi:16S rRNA (guanine(966)-N(2))-methyltransferase RsmD